MFAQPWAWLGLVGLAVPIAIHLLARHQAIRTRFPTLRFIDITDVTFIKRQHLTDIPLLLVRLALVAMAVAALAQPHWASGAAGTGPKAIAVVVDTSAGVVGDEGPAAARAEVQGAASSTIVEAESLRAGIASASAWLATASGTRELVVVSDFQRGALDADAVAAVPAGAGLRFHVLPMLAPKLPDGFELRGEHSRMSWPVMRSDGALPLAVRAGPDQARADAMLRAVASLAVTTPVDATARHATLVFANAPERGSLAAAPPISQPWMFAVMQPLFADPQLRTHVVGAASGSELIVLVDAEPGSADAAAITSNVLASLVQPLAWAEFEPATIAPEQLKQWERAPSAAPSKNVGESQGRWLWLIALLLLGVETWMRRRAAPASTEEAHARVA